MPKTRKKLFCKVFCLTKEFDKNVLPTKADPMKHLFCRLLLRENANGKDPSVRDISNVVLQDLKGIWQKASIPIISDQRILCLIADINKEYKSIKKNLLKLQNKATMFKKICEITV